MRNQNTPVRHRFVSWLKRVCPRARYSICRDGCRHRRLYACTICHCFIRPQSLASFHIYSCDSDNLLSVMARPSKKKDDNRRYICLRTMDAPAINVMRLPACSYNKCPLRLLQYAGDRHLPWLLQLRGTSTQNSTHRYCALHACVPFTNFKCAVFETT